MGLLSARAETRIWNNNTGNGLWSDAGNWSGGALPEAGDAVVFDGTVSQDACTADAVANNLASLTLAADFGGAVTFGVNAVEGDMILSVAGDIAVLSGNLVLAGDVNAIGAGTAQVKFGRGYTLQAATISVADGAAIHADGRGFPLRQGPGAGDTAGNGDNRGAGYGGEGALRVLSTGRGMPYGSATAPTALGSGGGHSSSGPGGGALKLVASGTITIDGRLSANGGNGTMAWGFGGSGGSIWIASGTLYGAGVIASNAGFSSIAWRGSGGGRIDISGTVNHFGGDLQVLGGDISLPDLARRRGMAGSILLPQSAGTGWTRDHLVVASELRLGNSLTFGAIVVTNGGSLWLDANEGLDTFSFDTLDVHDASQVVFPGNRERVNTASGGTTTIPHGGGATLTGATVTVHSGGRLQADHSGFPRTHGPGGVPYDNPHRDFFGAGHGGAGGGSDGSTYGLVYGTAVAPSALGSGGANNQGGGTGGGAFTLLVSGDLTVDGFLTAKGQNASNSYGGGGSGGSLWLDVGVLKGTGVITANGGNRFSGNGRGGGGGRILLRHGALDFTGTLTAAGGTGLEDGAPGTVLTVNTATPNQPPAAPTLLHPADSAILQAPYVQLFATDPDEDPLHFKVEIARDADFTDIVRSFDQTLEQADWYGQTEQGRTAYLGNGTATAVISPPLDPDTAYFWRAFAIDPDGADAWSPASAVRTFATAPTPANYWVGNPDTNLGDDLWTNANNWSRRAVPTVGEAVVFGGDFFNRDCLVTAAPLNLASLTLAAGYSRTVRFAPNAVEGGMRLVLDDSLTVESGALVFQGDMAAVGSGTAETPHGRGYRIEVSVLLIGSNGVVHADQTGFPFNQGPGAGTGAVGNDYGRGGGYGGRGGDGSNTNLWYGGAVYGTAFLPDALGSGGGHPYARRGGGAIWIVVKETATIDGRLSADGGSHASHYDSAASGGSLLVAADTIAGTGLIAARGGNAVQGGGGGGGRISIIFGEVPETRAAILSGDMERARLMEELTAFNGITSAAPGTGYFNGPPQGAEEGSIVYLRALPPAGTMFLIR